MVLFGGTSSWFPYEGWSSRRFCPLLALSNAVLPSRGPSALRSTLCPPVAAVAVPFPDTLMHFAAFRLFLCSAEMAETFCRPTPHPELRWVAAPLWHRGGQRAQPACAAGCECCSLCLSWAVADVDAFRAAMEAKRGSGRHRAELPMHHSPSWAPIAALRAQGCLGDVFLH